jgi:hypothetical protein
MLICPPSPSTNCFATNSLIPVPTVSRVVKKASDTFGKTSDAMEGCGSEKPGKTLRAKDLSQGREQANHYSTDQKPDNESIHLGLIRFVGFLNQAEGNFLSLASQQLVLFSLKSVVIHKKI